MKNKILAIIIALTLNNSFAIAQQPYAHDRVYTANQISNTVSVIDPSEYKLLGEIKLGKPYPNVLTPLYKGQVLVHGLRYSEKRKLLAVVSIGSNSIILISTENNKVLKTIYLGRSPHEPTFTPDSKQIWVSVRGESYVSVIDVDKMKEVKRITVANGPGMIAFTNDGKFAYVCSSFTPELDVVETLTYRIIKKIPVVSPFSPNIFTSPDGKWIAMTHKDVGKVTVINSAKMLVEKVINTGAITNHVTFSLVNNKLLMFVTVGGENKIKIFDVAKNFKLTDSINVGELPHGIWPSPDGKTMFVGLEYGDQVQAIGLQNMNILKTIKIGQSPQALVYGHNAVPDTKMLTDLSPLDDTTSTQVVTLKDLSKGKNAAGRLSVRSIGLANLVEQIFTGLIPNSSYTLALSKSANPPYGSDYKINNFTTDEHGKYAGQSTGLVKTLNNTSNTESYGHVILIDDNSKAVILKDDL